MSTRWDVVYGPPGTGKTTELLRRMDVLKKGDAPPSSFGFLAFTRAAASEALKRLGLRNSPYMRTIHSLAYEKVGVDKSQVVDAKKLKEFAQLTNLPMSGDEEAPDIGDECLSLISYARARMIPTGDAYEIRTPALPLQTLEYAEKAYSRWKKSCGYLDFDDMLAMYAEGGEPLPVKYLFVDEAQDLSPLQWAVLHRIVSQDCLCVTLAGDDDQAIYSWAGADAHGMRTNSLDRGGKVVVLERSHRIPRSVHRLATTVVQGIGDRVEKAYLAREEEGSVQRWGGCNDLELCGHESTLVLYRNHSLRAELEDWVIGSAVPYRTTSGKPSLFDSRYGTAIRALHKLKRNEGITTAQERAVRAMAPGAQDLPITALASLDWRRDFSIPSRMYDYFSRVDLFAEPSITMGTIHSAKGAEADRVILCDGMGGRTAEGLDDEERRVWYVAVTRAKHRLDIVPGDNPFPLDL